MNGKGSKPRNNFSEEFRNNYDGIDWGKKKKSKQFERFDLDIPDESQLEGMDEKSES